MPRFVFLLKIACPMNEHKRFYRGSLKRKTIIQDLTGRPRIGLRGTSGFVFKIPASGSLLFLAQTWRSAPAERKGKHGGAADFVP